MRLALLGDIHGNEAALAIVLRAASKAKVDKLLVTGDLVGYYFSPQEVLNLLNDWDCHIVSGNHEVMLAHSRSDPDYLADISKRYGSGLQIALEQLDSQQLDRLCSLPHPLKLEFDGLRILLCHGSPWDINAYLYPDSDIDLLGQFFPQNYDLVVLGHTHYPMQKEIGFSTVINPGSVGQPRNRKPGAHWALYDTESREAQFYVEEYDSRDLIRECESRHPELPYLANTLMRSI